MKHIVFIFLIIIFIILLINNNNKTTTTEKFQNNNTFKYLPLTSYDNSIITESLVSQRNFFELKHSTNIYIKYYLLYNKYIDLLNRLDNSNISTNLQTLNSNCNKLFMKLLNYLCNKNICPPNPSDSSSKKYIMYNTNHLNIQMMVGSKVFNLSDYLKNNITVLVYKINENYIIDGLSDNNQWLIANSQSIDIGFNSSNYASTLKYLKSFDYGTNIQSIVNFLMGSCAMIYNHCFKEFNNFNIKLDRINMRNINNNKYINKLITHKYSKQAAAHRFMNSYNTSKISLKYPSNLNIDNLKQNLNKQLNLNSFTSGDNTPPYKVDKYTLEVMETGGSIFNEFLNKLGSLNNQLDKINNKYNIYKSEFNTINNKNKKNEYKYKSESPLVKKHYGTIGESLYS